MTDSLPGVLVLCTGNSARSILGEAMLARAGEGRLRAYSAGSQPKGAPHPAALRLLARRGFDLSRFHSKSWDAFTGPDAPRIDVAITVCDNAARETCPIFPGAPVKAHWGLPDPAEVTGSDAAIDAAFEETWQALEQRVKALVATRFEDLPAKDLAALLAAIGRQEPAR